MKPGNAAALHSTLSDYAEYAEFPVELGDEEVTVYHRQYAKYPIERAARTLYDGLQFDPAQISGREDAREVLAEITMDAVDEVVESDRGLNVALHDEDMFDDGQWIDGTDLFGELTRLGSLYSGYEVDEGEPWERYGEARRLPETRVQFVADLLTLYNVQLAEQHLHSLRYHTYDEPWTEDEALVGLYAMRDLVEKSHGWSVFRQPDPSEEEVADLWAMAEEVGFEPQVEWVYALYTIPRGAKWFSPTDATKHELRHSMDETMHSAIADEMGRGVTHGLKWAAEDTSAADLEAHRREMRERWEAELIEG